MDPDIRTRDALEEHWRASERGDIESEHAIYAEDAILDYPQSGERFRGRATISAQRGGHPADRHFTVHRIVGFGDLWVSECVITYEGVPTYRSASWNSPTGKSFTRLSTSQMPSVRPTGAERWLSRCRAGTSPVTDPERGLDSAVRMDLLGSNRV